MRLNPILICLLLFSTPLFAWNSTGHRIIAQIAYDQLTLTAKEKVDALTAIRFHSKYPEERFLKASTWPDTIRKTAPQCSAWHYIDLPFVKDNIKPAALDPENVVTEITRAEKIVADKTESSDRRAKYLSFLIHFVGDIHQPLHCATLYSKQFPESDRGGNNYFIHTAISKDLHWYWDEGLGLFYSPPHNYQFRYYQVESIAKQWMTQYPPSFFGAKLQNLSIIAWAQEGHQIAVNFVYSIPENTAPSKQYIQQGQTIVREQAVLAGDRLAFVLNKIF
ncbi:MAG: S1/P1 nuclease [Gammaproteobacteria bacterium]|nr:S1/P1 nuclease [Gammaproteobacteria bacterium]